MLNVVRPSESTPKADTSVLKGLGAKTARIDMSQMKPERGERENSLRRSPKAIESPLPMSPTKRDNPFQLMLNPIQEKSGMKNSPNGKWGQPSINNLDNTKPQFNILKA
jgi:hypothetical protein